MDESCLVRRLAAAWATGDTAELEDVLAPDVVVVCDGGGRVRAVTHPVCGTASAIRVLADLPGTVTVEHVNGRTGLAVRRADCVVAVVSIQAYASRITAMWITLNPDKLRNWISP